MRWKNEHGEWVILDECKYGWIDYKKQAYSCKNCKSGPYSLGAVTCADLCQKGIIYILERGEDFIILYTAKISNDKAEPDKKILEARSLLSARELWQYLAQQGVAQYLP
jgi:hypothetical protein